MTTINIQFSTLLSNAVNQPGIISEAYSAFHNYSLGNVMAAAFQCAARGIKLGPIASYKAWTEKGRQVKKGEKAIALCMPITMKSEKENKSTGETEEHVFSRFVWKNNWFVLWQTEGEDFANEIPVPSWDRELALNALGITEGTFDHYNGNCQGYASGASIAINPLAQYPHKTRFHELAHVVLGHTLEHTMTDHDTTPQDIREVEAESVAYILCSLLSLPGLDESRGYIQHWLRSCEIQEKSAQKIFSAADKIMKAGQVKPQ
ncbi:ArdC-like ssDNA-binding domain-containing protein [Nitrosomonas ureae]|uniref:N-terminal domain-containing protein n=1 Tax=Nitrosomonas ureae TaxID=44577 RepID=A0A1H2ENN5_9PROT|nr:ArdC-like ssDNA-binding domain-containing protein [Nitrosomonas ureae]ALQ51910.1 hypothetical protein ATY38_12180 [Nitrosomonas ureae]SDT96701.1 protein of unknown function [Nitrosomonas ureae]